MEDEQIIALYFSRDDRAIRETEAAYGGRLLTLSRRILNSREDALEQFLRGLKQEERLIFLRRPHAGFQIVPGALGDQAHHIGADGAAQVTGHGQQGKHGGAAHGDRAGGNADGARPHDSHGEATQHTAQQPQGRASAQRRQQ